jgi:hypothetical protein
LSVLGGLIALGAIGGSVWWAKRDRVTPDGRAAPATGSPASDPAATPADRQRQKHDQAWQVINAAQGKGGSGGRIEALQDLNLDHVPLTGVNVAGAFLQGIQLQGANLSRAELEGTDLRDANLQGSDLEYANLKSANLRQSNLSGCRLEGADLEDADLVNADLREANLRGAKFNNADLRNANLQGILWQNIQNIEKANIHGVRNPPEGFGAWAIQHKAISVAGEQ